MTPFLDEEAIYQLWLRFFENNNLTSEIRAIADNYPDSKVLHVSYHDLLLSSDDLSQFIIEKPSMTIKIGETAINSLLEPDQKVGIWLSIKDLPESYDRSIEFLEEDDVGKLRTSEVIMVKPLEPGLLPLVAVFKCRSCGFKQQIDQEKFQWIEPLDCPKGEGGCGKKIGSTKFDHIEDESLNVDFQICWVQDPMEDLKRAQRFRKALLLEDYQVQQRVEMGDRVRINYIVETKKKSKEETIRVFILKCVHIQKLNKIEEVQLTEKQKKEFRSSSFDIIDIMTGSIAPKIFGWEILKIAGALQLVGVPPNPTGDEKEELDILLFGDGGTGKSQIMIDLGKIWSKFIFTGAKTASAAGLTMAVIPDEYSRGNYPEPGALVLGDKGLVGIDELDKARPEDLDSMHIIMSDRFCPLNKAGFDLKVPTSPSILACANPKDGRDYQMGLALKDQTNLKDTLRQRFDLIFEIWDSFNMSIEEEKSNHLLDCRDPNSPVGERKRSIEWLRGYVQYAKEFNPHLTKPINRYISSQYVKMRQEFFSGQLERKVNMRTLDSISRLSQAVARLFLQEEVQMHHVDISLSIVRRSYQPLINGENDSISIEVSRPKPEPIPASVTHLQSIILKLDKGRGALERDVLAQARERGLYKVEDQLQLMQNQGVINYPRSDRISLNGGSA